MKKKELEKRIEQLEKELSELKTELANLMRPTIVYFPVYQPPVTYYQPFYVQPPLQPQPIYPIITCTTSGGSHFQ